MILCKHSSAEFADIHCHILPGVDDGAGDRQEALKMLEIAYHAGITHMIVTPHYKEGRHNVSPAGIKKRLLSLQKEAEDIGIFISLFPGNEIFYFSEIEERLRQGKIQTLNGSHYLLIEFLPSESFVSIRNAVIHILSTGYIPIVAHAERYLCMLKHDDYIEELRMLGAEIQINISSIEGKMGYEVKRFTHRILKRKLVDYLGTDAHDCKRRTPDVRKCMDRLYRKYDMDYIDSISYLNALQIIEEEQYT